MTIGFHYARRALEQTRLAQVESIAELKAKKIVDYFHERTADATIAGEYNVVKDNFPVLEKYYQNPLDPNYLRARQDPDQKFSQLQKLYGYNDILLVNLEGKIIYCSNQKHSSHHLGKPLPDPGNKAFQEGKNRVFMSDIFKNPLDPLPPFLYVDLSTG